MVKITDTDLKVFQLYLGTNVIGWTTDKRQSLRREWE
jgi:aryl-alcohol dehydrogenase-like predicted oxidoreductase